MFKIFLKRLFKSNAIYFYNTMFKIPLYQVAHCQTEKEGQICTTCLLRLCDPVDPLVLILRTRMRNTSYITMN